MKSISPTIATKDSFLKHKQSCLGLKPWKVFPGSDSGKFWISYDTEFASTSRESIQVFMLLTYKVTYDMRLELCIEQFILS